MSFDLASWISAATSCRRAGQSAREEAEKAFQEQPIRTSLAPRLRVHAGECAWRNGAKGEQSVGRILDRALPCEDSLDCAASA